MFSIIPNSVLAELLHHLPQLRPQIYFKSSLTALSHAMEDQVLAGSDEPLVIASFQRERFYRQEAHRYRRIAARTTHVYVLAAPETDFKNSSEYHETVAFEPSDPLSQEWHLVVIGQQYSTCLICQERNVVASEEIVPEPATADQARQFEGIWTFDRPASCKAAEVLLNRISVYRPELADKIDRAKSQYLGDGVLMGAEGIPSSNNPDPFVQRLVTYLQAGQHKLLKAYASIAAQERKERLVNLITAAVRRSLDPNEMMQVAVQELGEVLSACRCLIYRCKAAEPEAKILHEYLGRGVRSLLGQTWPLQDNPLFQEVVRHQERVYMKDTRLKAEKSAVEPENPGLSDRKAIPPIPSSTTFPVPEALVSQWQINSWLMVPVLYQGRLLGIVELHQCRHVQQWEEDELALVDAIATQLGAALIQAETYANLEELNQQLEALDRTRSNLIAITGHELRTPLSTIQVCLESLSSEPDMPPELRKVMLDTALGDAERMRKLVQDFLTLSQLESGRVEWNLESLPLQECVELALSSIRARRHLGELPIITTQVPPELPLVQVDGEWLVEVLSKLIDNACKFTLPKGQVTIQAQRNGNQMVEVLIADTGRGITPDRLEVVFDRFYQEEGALRRSTGGTGLGLAICRQIVNGWGGQIWADSAGKDQGCQFHFTIPTAPNSPEPKRSPPKSKYGQRKMKN